MTGASRLGGLATLRLTWWRAGGRRLRVGGLTNGWRVVAVWDRPAPIVAGLAAAGRAVWPDVVACTRGCDGCEADVERAGTSPGRISLAGRGGGGGSDEGGVGSLHTAARTGR